MSGRENVRHQQLESAEAVRDPLTDAFFRLKKPEQVIQFYLSEAKILMNESNHAYTPERSLETVFNKFLPPVCILAFFYPEKINLWGTSLREIDTMLHSDP